MKAFSRNDDGAATIDFAIVSLAFILCIVGLLEFGRVFYTRGKLSFAADSAARLVLISSSSEGADAADADEVLAKAKAAIHDTSLAEAITYELGSVTDDGVTYRTIRLTYTMPLLIPGLGDGVTLSQFRMTPQL